MISIQKPEITQGLVFYGIRSPYYPEIPCYGIVITARCDLAQNKVKHVHYITAIPTQAWIMGDCFTAITEEIIYNSISKVKTWMGSNELNSNLVEQLGPQRCRKIIDAYSLPKAKILQKEIDDWILANDLINNKKVPVIYQGQWESKKKNKIDALIKNQGSGAKI